MSVRQISKYESGAAQPRPKAIYQLASALEIHPRVLCSAFHRESFNYDENDARPAPNADALELPQNLFQLLNRAAAENGNSIEDEILDRLINSFNDRQKFLIKTVNNDQEILMLKERCAKLESDREKLNKALQNAMGNDSWSNR